MRAEPPPGLVVGWHHEADEAITHLDWSRAGVLAVGTADGHVVVLDDEGRLRARHALAGDVTSLVWSPSGAALAVGADDGTVQLFAEGTAPATTVRGGVSTMAWHPFLDLLAVGADTDVVLLDGAAERFGAAELTGSAVHSLAWTGSGGRLAVGTTTGLAWFDLELLDRLVACGGVAGAMACLALAPETSSDRLAVLSLDSVLVRSVDDEHVIEGFADPPPGVSWDSAGTLLAVPADDEVTVWSLPGPTVVPADEEPLRLLAHRDAVSVVDFAPWGHHLLSAGRDGLVLWWTAQALDDPAAIDLGAEVLVGGWHPRRASLAAGTRSGDLVLVEPVDA